VISLGRWAGHSPSLPRDAPIGVDSVMLALKGRFEPAAAAGLRAVYELRFGDDRFQVTVSDGALEIVRGTADHPDTRIDTDPGTLFALLSTGRSLAEAQRAGEISIDGDVAAAGRLLHLFPPPQPAGSDP
jgi:alkyl sulfatase BDS1-like metallo-beta-lactamase superfamily hydrolase